MATLSGSGFPAIDLGHLSSERAPSTTGVISFTIPGEDASETEAFSLIGGERNFSLQGIYTTGDDASFADPEDWVEEMMVRLNNQVANIDFFWVYGSDRYKNPTNSSFKFWNVKIIEFIPDFTPASTDDVRYNLILLESAP